MHVSIDLAGHANGGMSGGPPLTLVLAREPDPTPALHPLDAGFRLYHPAVMPSKQPWRDLAKYSNDELVDAANEALLRSDHLYQKQIGFEMWRREANTAEESKWYAIRGPRLTLAVALFAVAYAIVAYGTLWLALAVLAVAAFIVITVAVEDWSRPYRARKRHWPHHS